MGISAFEAAAVYDYHAAGAELGESGPIQSVVYDLDHYSVGFCSCSEGGQVQLLGSFVLDSGKRLFAEDLARGLGGFAPGSGRENFSDALGDKLDGLNQKMRAFLQSERQLDGVAASISGIDLSCSEFENAFRDVEKHVEALLSASLPLWAENGIEEDAARIILVGRGAEYYPAEFVIRSALSFDPFLADERFVNGFYPVRPSRIVEAGTDLYTEQTSIGFEISIHVLGRDGGEEGKRLADRRSPAVDFDEPRYLGPIFVSARDSLELEVNAARRQLKLPYSVSPADGDLIEAAVLLKEAKPVLRIRRCGDPARIYDVPVA